MKNLQTKNIVLTALFAAFSSIAFTIENLLPPFFIPGVRLGFSNIFILISALIIGRKNGYIVLIIKIIIGCLATGNISSIIYSLFSGILSYTIEILLIFSTKNITVLCASIFGSVINVLTQNLIFCIVTKTFEYLLFAPYLIVLGVISGTIVGLVVFFTIKKINKISESNLEKQS